MDAEELSSLLVKFLQQKEIGLVLSGMTLQEENTVVHMKEFSTLKPSIKLMGSCVTLVFINEIEN